jgi:hypothetical protein
LGGVGRGGSGRGSGGGGDATAGFDWNAAYAVQGGWGSLVPFGDYGTDTNNYTSTFTLSGVVIAATAGRFSCTYSSSILTVGMAVIISGTKGGTGTIPSYTNPTTYYIITTNGSTTFTLSATLGGSSITTTAGTPTGLTYTVVPPTSSKGYFGGGGAGGNWFAYGFVAGGRGGGGNSPSGNQASTAIGLPAGINTGGGGGGGGATYNASRTFTNGGAGGSGIVIIRYPDRGYPTPSTTGSPTITSGNGAITYAFTSSGSLTF